VCNVGGGWVTDALVLLLMRCTGVLILVIALISVVCDADTMALV